MEKFLGFYKEYTLDNFELWQSLDKEADLELEKDYQIKLHQWEIHKQEMATKNRKPWWKFW